MRVTERHLAWEGCYNARDLGGLATADGGETRWRAVIRSDQLGRLTARGRQMMLDYGVRTIIDLRAASETVESPSVSAPDGGTETFAYLNRPILTWDPDTEMVFRQATTQAQAYSTILDTCQDAVVEIMRAIANAQSGGVVVHCHSGKDRTGTVSALLLRLAGVPDEAIAADYAASKERLLVWVEEVDDVDPGQPEMWSPRAITAQTMLDVLAYVDAKYGSVEAYLEGGGLTAEEQEQLRERLLGDG